MNDLIQLRSNFQMGGKRRLGMSNENKPSTYIYGYTYIQSDSLLSIYLSIACTFIFALILIFYHLINNLINFEYEIIS